MNNAKNVNYRSTSYGVMVAVECPKCKSRGAHSLQSPQPVCHICGMATLMFPASNTGIECTWEDAIVYSNSSLQK